MKVKFILAEWGTVEGLLNEELKKIKEENLIDLKFQIDAEGMCYIIILLREEKKTKSFRRIIRD